MKWKHRKHKNVLKRLKEESKEEVIKRWQETLQQANSLTEKVFQNGKVTIMSDRDLEIKLEKLGVHPDDIDDVIREAQRAKLILAILPSKQGELVMFKWLTPEEREEEKLKTQRLLNLVDEVYMSKKVDHLTEEELKNELKVRGLSDEDAERAIYEAERDCILSFCLPEDKWAYSWIPPDDRKYENVRRRVEIWFSHKRLEKKAMQGDL